MLAESLPHGHLLKIKPAQCVKLYRLPVTCQGYSPDFEKVL